MRTAGTLQLVSWSLTREMWSSYRDTGIWRSPEDAKLGGQGPGHRQAMKETQRLYLEWKIEQLALMIGPDAATWDIVDWGSK